MRALTAIMCVCACLLAGTARSREQAGSVVVTPAWLAEHLQDPSVVVLHVAGLREDYDREHIPGARFLWLTWLAESTPERSTELPPVKKMVKVLEELGVSTDSKVVVYHMLGDPTAAARVFVTLDYLGLGDRAYILDGGLEAWKADGRPVTTEIPKIRRGSLKPAVRPEVLADLKYIASKYQDRGIRMVDGRSAQAFNMTGGVNVVRGGHIPGAVNLPASTLVDSTNRYLPPDSLSARFAAAGVQTGDQVIAYCAVGRSACMVYVAARMLGYNVRLYDGSFEEWSRRMELPVENKSAK
jgi:thiosulfate/3-mercaptopyruvate sulfurtransferase